MILSAWGLITAVIVGHAAQVELSFAGGIAFHLLFGLAYFTLLEGPRGRSPGKWLTRVRVVTASGAPLGWARTAGRAAIAWAVPTLASDALLLPLGGSDSSLAIPAILSPLVVFGVLLFVPARPRNGFQAWHDRWTGTQVIAMERDIGFRLPVSRAAVWLAVFSFLIALWPPPLHGRDPLVGVSVMLATVALVLSLTAWRAVPIVVVLSTCAFVLFAASVKSRSRGGGNEASAIGSMRTISSAQTTYSAMCAAGGYATDLADLAKAEPGSTLGFIPPDLNANGVVKSGYIFTVARDAAAGVTDVSSPGKTCNGSAGQPVSSYFASANPVSRKTGKRYFATDARGMIFVSTSGPIPNPIPANAMIY